MTSFLPEIWFVLLGVVFAVYLVLDGYDFGVGMLNHIAHTDLEKRAALNAIAPVWDGNEVWLVTAGGALFAAFPEAYATAFSAFYEAFVLFLLALIMRACSIEFRSKLESSTWRTFWDRTFSVASFSAPLLLGIAFGNILWGIPLDSNREFTGTFLSLLGPFPLMIGITACALFYCHGAIYLAIKTEGELSLRAATYARNSFWAVVLCVAFVAAVMGAASSHLDVAFRRGAIGFAFPIIAVAALVLLDNALRGGRLSAAFAYSSTAIVALLFAGGIALFPRLVPSEPGPANSVTIMNAASSTATLKLMLAIVAAGLPLVVLYTYYVHRVFKGKVKLDETSY